MYPFGWWIAVYFAFATLAAGAAAAACATIAARPADAPRARSSLFAALVAITLGAGALVLDLERPGEFWFILTHYNPESWISRGSRIIVAFGLVVVGALFTVEAGSSRRWLLVWCVVLALLSVLVAIYPAFVLAQEVGRPLWQSAILPALFVAGAAHVAAAVAGAPTWLELAITVAELVLFAAYGATIGFALFVSTPTAVTLVVVAVLATWVIPIMLMSMRSTVAPRVAAIAVGCFGIRASILYLGQVGH